MTENQLTVDGTMSWPEKPLSGLELNFNCVSGTLIYHVELNLHEQKMLLANISALNSSARVDFPQFFKLKIQKEPRL